MKIYLNVFILVLVGCASPHPPDDEFNKISLGMLKSEVLDVAGTPRWTDRHKGQDVWIYLMKPNDRSSEQLVYFEDGKVVQKGTRNTPALTADEMDSIKNDSGKPITYKPSLSEEELRKVIKKEVEEKNPPKKEKFEKL